MSNKLNQELLSIESKVLSFMEAQTSDSAPHLLMAKMRFNELMCLLTLASGVQYPWRKELMPVSNEIDVFLRALEERNARPLVEDPEHPENLEAQIDDREDCAERIAAARNTAMCMLVHLNLALNIAKPNTPDLKAV